MPELMSIATGIEARSSAVDKFGAAFSVAGEKQQIRAEYETRVWLERFSGKPAIEKARAKFENAQKIEEGFHKDFDGADFTLERQSLFIREPRLLRLCLSAALGRPVDEAGHRASTP